MKNFISLDCFCQREVQQRHITRILWVESPLAKEKKELQLNTKSSWERKLSLIVNWWGFASGGTSLSLRGSWWTRMWRSLRTAITWAKRLNRHRVWPGNSSVAAGLGTCFHTKERIIPGTKMDAGRERLPVEMGKLMIWPGKEAAAEMNQRLLVVLKRRGYWYPIQAFREGRTVWLQIWRRA